MNAKRGLSLVETVRWVITTLVDMAQNRAWGEIKITVQGGQIEFVHESRSHRDRLPQAGTGTNLAEVVRDLAAAS